METRNFVRQDLDMFDAKFGSDDAMSHCTAVSNAENDASRLPSCTAVPESDIDRDRGHGQQMSMLEAGDKSSTSAARLMATSSCGLAVPTGSFQFQADWKRLKKHPEEFYRYFKVTAIICVCQVPVAAILCFTCYS